MFDFDVFDRYAARFPGERETIARSRAQLTAPDVLARSSFPGHVTASAIIPQGGKSQDWSLLTVWHPLLQQWLQPGGHVDPGETVLAAALREAREETGFACELTQGSDLPFDIDCLFVPDNPRKGEPAHWHIDVRYLMRPVRWAGEPELPTACIPIGVLGTLTPSLDRLAVKMQALRV